jgi:hypothetical protein
MQNCSYLRAQTDFHLWAQTDFFTLHNSCLVTWIVENLVSSGNKLCICCLTGPEAAEFAALTIPSFLLKSAALRYTH